mmetsp:Transcript_68868/g.161943  ORF Transcript_68868/g.161943 Transcript_68868/m.161943 type:complete len:205 (+) Transcript_68868:821-1435(+)
MPSAVVLDAALLLVAAAPVLLGIRPSLHPIRPPRRAVVDAPMSMADAMRDVQVLVVAAVPCPRAAEACMCAAPTLLVAGPSEIPVGIPGVAVVLPVVGRRDRHVNNMNLWGRGHGHRPVDDVWRRRRRWRDIVHSATSALVLAAPLLMLVSPHVTPIMVTRDAVVRISWHIVDNGIRPHDWFGPHQIPQQKTQEGQQDQNASGR